MSIKQKRYLVEFTTEPGIEHEVRVTVPDLLRAEREGPRFGIKDPTRQSMQLTVMYLWAAAMRLYLVEPCTFHEFADVLLDFDVVRQVDGTPAEDVAADPTRLAVSGDSASPSPTPYPDSTIADGSTPPSSSPN